MDALRSKLVGKYEKLAQKYRQRSAYFDQVIERWQRGWSRDLAEKSRSARAAYESAALYLGSQEKNNDFEVHAFKKALKQAHRSYGQLYAMTKPLWRQWLEAIFVALFAVVILRNFVFGLYHVPTGSAEPTLLVGDRVWGNNMAYLWGAKPHYGDLVMFYEADFPYSSNKFIRFWQRYVNFGIPFLGIPSGPMNIVKRVIACPGDTIEGRVEGGEPVLYRNGKKLDEPYLNPYPLILMNRSTGFIPMERILGMPIPSFLQQQKRPVFYTYNPHVTYDQQPFYHMSSADVYHPMSDTATDITRMLSADELRRIMADKSTFYYLQTIRSGQGKIARDESGNKIVLKDPRDPEVDVRAHRCADEFGPITLLPGYYWVQGDSRRQSYDSRFWGPLHASNIYGRASFIIYSIDSEEPFWLFELIRHPIDFWRKSVRWNRFFKGISNDNRVTQQQK